MKNLLITTTLIMFACPVFAETVASPDDGTYMRKKVEYYIVKADTNGDGFVSKDEMQAYNEKMFDEADTNKDGKLSTDELMNYKMKEMDDFKAWLGKNNSDVSNAIKLNK